MPHVPTVFEDYLSAWRSSDPETIRRFVEQSLAADIVWCDPNYDLVGRESVVEMIVEFHSAIADPTLALTTKVDAHHDRYRYEWLVSSGGRPLVRGTDIAHVNGDGLIQRIDGFFGPLESLA